MYSNPRLSIHRINTTIAIAVVTSLLGCASRPKTKPPAEVALTKSPKLTSAEVNRIWIPDRIEGNRYEEGHWLFVIDKPVSWGKE